MPLLSTLIAIHFLGGSEESGFLNPAALRAGIENELGDSPNHGRALDLAGQLEAMGKKYNEAADKALKAYQSKSVNWDSSADDLIKILEPLDRQRAAALEGAVRIRQAMLELLTEDEWNQLFA